MQPTVMVTNKKYVEPTILWKYDINHFLLQVKTASKYCQVEDYTFFDGKNYWLGLEFEPEYIQYTINGKEINLVDFTEYPLEHFGQLMDIRDTHPEYWNCKLHIHIPMFNNMKLLSIIPQKHEYLIWIQDIGNVYDSDLSEVTMSITSGEP